jgi:hypothetical protein
MDEAKVMDGLNGEDALGHVEPGDVFAKGIVLDEHGHKIATGQEFHEEVEVLGVLEGVVELDDPGRVGLGEDVALGSDVGELCFRISVCMKVVRKKRAHLVLLEHFGLAQRLHGVDLARVDLLH